MEDCLFDAMSLLNQLSSDNTIAKSVRKTVTEVIDILSLNEELPVKCDKAIQLLTINEDPNIDPYTRTQIWSLLSMLESIV